MSTYDEHPFNIRSGSPLLVTLLSLSLSFMHARNSYQTTYGMWVVATVCVVNDMPYVGVVPILALLAYTWIDSERARYSTQVIPSLSVTVGVCTTSTALLIVLFAYAGCIMLWGTFMSVRSRSVPRYAHIFNILHTYASDA